MVEGKLRKLSQIADDLLLAMQTLKTSLGAYDRDEFNYLASPTTLWDTQGDTYTGMASGGFADLATGNMAGDGAWVAKTANNGIIDVSSPFVVRFRALVSQLTEAFTFIGLVDVLPTEADPPVEPTDALFFKRTDAAGVGNWFARSIDNGVATEADSGIAGDGTQAHDYMIVGDGTNARFYIDDVLVGTLAITTNNPLLFPVLMIVTGENVIKGASIDTYENATSGRAYP